MSGEAHPTGTTPDPLCPGIKIVPAQPKFENCACRVTEPPSLKSSVEVTWRMNPALSTDTIALFDV